MKVPVLRYPACRAAESTVVSAAGTPIAARTRTWVRLARPDYRPR